MRVTGTATGGDTVEWKEVDLRVSGHHSSAEDFMSAVGKGDSWGMQDWRLGKSWIRQKSAFLCRTVTSGQQGCLSHDSYLRAKCIQGPGVKFTPGLSRQPLGPRHCLHSGSLIRFLLLFQSCPEHHQMDRFSSGNFLLILLSHFH